MTPTNFSILTEDQHFITGLLQPEGKEAAEIVKYCKTGGLPEAMIRNEYNVVRQLEHVQGVRKALRLGVFHGNPALYLEYIPGRDLSEEFYAQKIGPAEALDIAVGLATVVEKVHRARIIHKNINPENILIRDQTREPVLIDFAVATSLALKVDANMPLDRLGGNLPYIAPEQTGRINFAVDFRSDYYSLGAVLYHLFTGEQPCKSKDPVEQVHFHLALHPSAPHMVNPAIPETLSALILKLLSKNPADRYQSAAGILYDLQECRSQFRATGKISSFQIGQKDFPTELRLNDRIYGREKETKILLSHLDYAAAGPPRIVLVGGYSGVGKTSLIREIIKPVYIKGGHFISGKFDQFQRDVPYSAMIRALDTWTDIILAENDDALSAWKQTLLEALGENGGLLTRLVPKIENLIGAQPTPPELDSDQAQSRFNHTIGRFFRAIARENAPLVIFLDDMQWADFATLELMKLLVREETGLRHCLILCAYRENEVDETHPFYLTIKELEKGESKPFQIRLEPLGKEVILEMLSDILHLKKKDIAEISDLFQKKTQGNPFFIKYFLESLRQDELLYFSFERERWAWDLQKIEQQSVTENVADLLTRSFSGFSSETIRVLQAAACAGNRFDLRRLSLCLGDPAASVLSRLVEAIEKEALIPAGNRRNAWFTTVLPDNEAPDILFRFSHDKIRYHLYDGISEGEKKRKHLVFGRLFSRETGDENVFEAVAHFNKALDLLDSASERLEVARLNLKAGRRAVRSGAYNEAHDLFQTGISLLPENAWAEQYDLALELHGEAAGAAYSGKQFELMNRYCNAVFKNARQPYDKLSAVRSAVLYLGGAVGDKKGAINLLRGVLKELDVMLPENPGNLSVLREIMKVRFALRGKSDDYILDLPPASSARGKAALELLTQTMPYSYRGYPLLYVVSVMKNIMLELKEGHTEDSAFNFVIYGLVNMAAFKDIDLGRRFFRISLKLQEKFGSVKSIPQTYAALYSGMAFLEQPASEILPQFAKAFGVSRELGNNYWAAIHLTLRYSRRLWTGDSLEAQFEEIGNEAQLLKSLDQKAYTQWSKIAQQTIACLLGKADHPARLSGEYFPDDRPIEELIEGNDTSICSFYFIAKYYLAALFGDREASAVFARKASLYIRDASTEYPMMVFHFYYALFNAVELAETGKGSLKITRQLGAFVKKMGAASPANFGGRVLLIDAAAAWARGDRDRAEKLFAQAAEMLEENGIFQDKALALELAGRLAVQKGIYDIAGYYFEEACWNYHKWGSRAKVDQIQKTYAVHISQFKSKQIQESNFSQITLGENIDFLSILKASKAIRDEIDLDKLLEKLMRIVLENGGATRGNLFLENSGKWTMEGAAETRSGYIEINVMGNIPGDQYRQLAESVVKFVVRTKETVVLNDAAREGNFTNDPWIASEQIPSILCLPLINQGKLIGVLYLENSLSKNAFTRQKAEVLKILSSDIAVSIENARLYFNLHQINKAYERFVPRQFLAFLNKDSITDLNLGDQVQKEMAVLFADIRNFTSISEQNTPEANFNFINNYLGAMDPVISRHRGFIDKYIGDAIMALFPTGPQDAVDAAVAMLAELRRYNEGLKGSGIGEIRVGIGINAGSLMLGIIGGENRWDGTVISDAVNLAARIEDLTRDYDVPLLISEFAMAQLENSDGRSIREIDRVKLKGKSLAVTVYEVFDADPAEVRRLKSAGMADFSQALSLFRQKRIGEARGIFEKLGTANPADTVVQTYIRRCEKAQSG